MLPGSEVEHEGPMPVTHARERTARGCVLSLALVAPFAAQGVRVNGPMTRGEGYDAGDVLAFQLTPDGGWAAFFADPDGDDRMELFGVPLGVPEPPRRLNRPLVAGGHLVEVQYHDGEPVFDSPWLAIGAGNRVVYRGDQDTDGVIELFSAPIDGSETPTTIGGPHVPFCLLTSDGTRAVFVADPEADGAGELYSAPIDGSAPPTKLNGPLVPGGGFDWSDRDVVLSPDGATAVYRLDEVTASVFELFAAPIDGGSAPVRISGSMVPGGDVWSISLLISPAGGRVVYVADATVDESYAIWSVPIDGSAAPVQLGAPLGNRYVTRPRVSISPDGSRVVYQNWDSGVYSVPIAGGPAVLLGGQQGPQGGSRVGRPEISPDNARVICLADWRDALDVELFSMPIDGSTTPVVLNGDVVFGGQVEEFVIAPGGGRLVYRADQETYGVVELYGVPLDGSAPAVKLNGPLPASASVSGSPRFAPDGAFVLFLADARVSGRRELWRVAPTGGVPTLLNGPLVAGGDVVADSSSSELRSGYDVTSDGTRIVYRADQRVDDAFALWTVPADRSAPPRELSGQLELGPVLGDVQHFAWAGKRLLYSADQEVDGQYGLYSADVGNTLLRIPVLLLGEGLTFSPSPDGAHVAFHPPPRCIFFYCELVAPLQCAPVDGSEPQWNASFGLGGRPIAFAFDSSSNRLVFTLEVLVQNLPFRGMGLFSASLDDHTVTSLTEPAGIVEDTIIGPPVLAPDASRVVFSQPSFPEGMQLWSVLIDRSQPPVELTRQAQSSALEFLAYQAGPGSDVAVFVANQELPGTFELFSVPIDGSAPPARLGPPLPGHADVDPAFFIGPDGERAFYLADLAEDGALELWAAPLDPSRGQVAVRLSANAVPGGGVAPGVLVSDNAEAGYRPQFALSPDGTRAVYRADQDIDEVFELYSVSTDGLGTPVKLNAPLGAGAGVPPLGFVLDPAGERVVFVAPDPQGALRPFAVPLDGCEPPLPLGGAFVEGGGLWLAPSAGAAHSFALTLDATRIVYLADQRTDETFELFVAPLDGSLPARALSSPLAPGGDVGSPTGGRVFAIAPDGTRVAYLADQLLDEVFELFVCDLDPEPPRVRREQLSPPLVGR